MTVSVDAVVYYRVNNATISITNVENAHHSTKLLAQTTLRNMMGTRPLHEILSERETISGNMQVNWNQFGIKREHTQRVHVNTYTAVSMFEIKPNFRFPWTKLPIRGESKWNESKCKFAPPTRCNCVVSYS